MPKNSKYFRMKLFQVTLTVTFILCIFSIIKFAILTDGIIDGTVYYIHILPLCEYLETGYPEM